MRLMSVLTYTLLLVGCRVAEVPTPGTVPGILGAIRVDYVADPFVEGDSVYAAFLPSERRIIVDRALTGSFRRAILAHERCHSALTDFGVVLESSVEERVCDAMAALEVAR